MKTKHLPVLLGLYVLSAGTQAAVEGGVFNGILSSVTDPESYLQSALGLNVSDGDPFTLLYALDTSSLTISLESSSPPGSTTVYSTGEGLSSVITLDFGVAGIASFNDAPINIAIADDYATPLYIASDLWTLTADLGRFADGRGGEIDLSLGILFIDPSSEQHNDTSFYPNNTVSGWSDPSFILSLRDNGSSETEALLRGSLLEGSALVPIPAAFFLLLPALGVLLTRRATAPGRCANAMTGDVGNTCQQ